MGNNQLSFISHKLRLHIDNLKKKNYKPKVAKAIALKNINHQIKTAKQATKELHELYLLAIGETDASKTF